MNLQVQRLLDEIKAVEVESVNSTPDEPMELSELTWELGPGERAWAAGATTPNMLWLLDRYRLVADLDASDRVVHLWLGVRILDDD